MRSLLAVCALAAALGARAAPPRAAPPPPPPRPAVPPNAIAFLGLRPTETPAYGPTAILQLAEAQRLRAFAEGVVALVSGSTVLRHDDLRGLVSPTYLAELFDCRGDVACQLRVAAPLRRAGVATALTGDSFADAEGWRIRLRRLDVASGQVREEIAFTLPRAAAETLGPWRAALQPLFQDTGSILVVTNVQGAACALDGRPCASAADGTIGSVPEGEHVVELSREGYRRGVRVVTVRRGQALRVALPLEELPVQAQKAPDPNSRTPTFEAPGETTRVTPFGFLRLAIGWDRANTGDREDPAAIPPLADGAGEGAVVILPRPAVAGITFQAPRRESGWQLRGAFSTAWVKDAGPELDSAYSELVKEDAGFRLLLGFGPGIVSGLTAGTLTLPEGFGDLSAAFVGVTLSKSFGPLVVEVFGGRHKSQFSSVQDPSAASPVPFGGARLAIVDERLKGKLYGEEYPLTIALSGLYGEERVGLADEAAFLGTTATPVREQLPIWVASLELHLPFGRWGSLAGEGWIGEDVHVLEGNLWQRPRVDPATGRHRPLRSVGGWGQLSFNAGPVELRLIGGIDRIQRGLEAGLLAPDDAPAVRQNGLAAVNAVWYLLDHLALGVQVHAVRTWYVDPASGRPTLVGVVGTSQLKF